VKRTARVPTRLSESLHKRLNAYALAASAAGVSVLALAQPTEARIVYTKAHLQFATNTIYPLDLNHDGITDFSFYDRSTFTGSGVRYDLLSVRRRNLVKGYQSGSGAAALKRGVRIGLPWESGGSFMAIASNHGRERGKWLNVKNRYLGVRFQISNQHHYGWIRLRVETIGYHITATLTGYAYETIPNKPIIAGQTHGRDQATLGRLAQGASGLSNRGKP
jgi:hypothetical protein